MGERNSQQSGFLYQQDGSVFHPGALTTGPWRPDAQHGGPPGGLLAYLCEQKTAESETIVRLHVNLLTGIPLEPLETSVRRHNVSRRVSHIEAELRHDGRPVAEAKALVLATGDVPEPQWRSETPDHPSWAGVAELTAPHWAAESDALAFHRDALEHRFVDGAFDRAGPARDWIRLKPSVVEGVVVTGFQQIMASVDVGSGISAVFDPAAGFGMINADIDVAFVAEPAGPWLLLDAVTHLGPDGTGVAVTHVYNEQRLVAVVTQCLLGTAFNPE